MADPAAPPDAALLSTATEGASAAAESALAEPALGHLLGRYVLIQRLGAGAMGVVYAAYDPKLDRKVALKLLKKKGQDEEMRARLVREAQALAQLQHPHVVSVYDVGTVDDQVFVAMELVAGETLRTWLQSPRTTDEILRVFGEAGRGLWAAHERGLVHRDFKPDNVMVGSDGAARVADFGLARVTGHSAGEGSPSSPVSATMTDSGVVMGTPAYMAPEQMSGELLDARTDQFSFCVALYEALAGARPFDAPTNAERLSMIAAGTLPAPAGRSITRALHLTLARGLAIERDHRFATMDALLTALALRPVWRPRLLALAAVLAVPLILVVGRGQLRAHQLRSCIGAADPSTTAARADRREQLRAAFVRAGRGHAERAADEVTRTLDSYADRWHELRAESCQASLDGTQTAELRDLRMACLDQRGEELRAVTELLARADTNLVDHVTKVTGGLSDLDSCSSVAALRAPVPPPNLSTRAAADALRLRLARVRPLGLARHLAEARPLAASVVADAQALGYAPVLAESWLEAAKLQDDHPKEGERMLHEAVAAAERGRHLAALVESWTRLGFVVGAIENRLADGDECLRHAANVLSGLGTDNWLQLLLWRAQGTLLTNEGKLADADATYARAVALCDRLPERVRSAELGLLFEWGRLRVDQGRYDDALVTFTRAQKMAEQLYGPGHVTVAQALIGQGQALEPLHREAEARDVDERALKIFVDLMGPKSADAALALMNLSNVVEDPARVNELLGEALAIRRQLYGADSAQVAEVLVNLGSARMKAKQLAEAEKYYRQALAIEEHLFGPDNVEVVLFDYNLGGVLLEEHRYAEAIVFLGRGLALKEKAMGPAHEEVAVAARELGWAYWLNGEPAKARPLIERAFTRLTELKSSELPAAQFRLAEVLAPKERARARQLALAARRALVATHDSDGVAEIDAWLAAHR